MQRIILICRHAEAQDPFPLQPDFERDLTTLGSQQARETGVWLRENFTKVDKILASPAKRTAQTARVLASKLYFAPEEVDYQPDLYNAREAELLNQLGSLTAEVKSVLLVGHNPGVTRLVREITGQMVGYLDTAQVVGVEINLEKWEDLHITTGCIAHSSGQQV